MILPVTNPESVKFIDLSNYKNIFDDCASCFRNPIQLNSYFSHSFNSSDDCPKLKVFNNGSYKVSLAMNLDDLQRVDNNVFVLSKGCHKILEKYKEKYWGFIICQLAKGNEYYHPFGYSHNIINNKVFIPTKHYHQKKNNILIDNFVTPSNINLSPMFQNNIFPLYTTNNNHDDSHDDDWSHDIYLYNIPNPRRNMDGVSSIDEEQWTNQNKINLGKISFDFGNLTYFDKLHIVGDHPNVDLIVPAF